MPIIKKSATDQTQATTTGPARSAIIKGGLVLPADTQPEAPPRPQGDGSGIRHVGDPDAVRSSSDNNPAVGQAPAQPQQPMRLESEEIKAAARAEAAEMIQQTQAKLKEHETQHAKNIQAEMEANNARCQEAFLKSQEDGFQRGKEEGMKVAQGEFVALMNEARNVLGQAIQGREALIKSATGEIARLALKVAEKIIGQEVNHNEDVVLHTIKQALDKVKARESVTVRVNPTDVEYVRMNKDTFERMVEGLKSFEVTSDPKVERGGCILETNLGNVDARIQTQLQVLTIAFSEVEKKADEPQ